MYSGSGRFQLDKEDIKRAFRGLLYTLAGAASVWLLGYAGTVPPTSTENVVLITVISGLANILKQWVSDNDKQS